MAVKGPEGGYKIELRVLVAEEVAFSIVLTIRMLEKRCTQHQRGDLEMDRSMTARSW